MRMKQGVLVTGVACLLEPHLCELMRDYIADDLIDGLVRLRSSPNDSIGLVVMGSPIEHFFGLLHV